MSQATQQALQRNIPLIYGLAFFQCFMVIVPVIVPFFTAKGLSLAEIFYLQAVFATVIVLLETPSGYFADLFGRRTALLLGSAIHGCGFLMLNFADGFFSLMLFEIALGVSTSLLSGADLALLYDSRKALETEEISGHSKGIAHLGMARSIAEGVGALLGGALAMISFDLMVLVQSAGAWMCLLLALFIVEPPFRDQSHSAEGVRIINVIRHLLQSDMMLRQIVIAIPLYSLATFNVIWLIQPYWEQQGLTLAVFGVLWCVQSLTAAAAMRFGFSVERRLGASGALVVIGLLPVIAQFGMAWFSGWIGIGIALLLFVGRGLQQVILVNALNCRVSGEFRATANSFTSFLFRLSFIVSGPLLGYVAQTQGLATALTALGIGYIAVFLLVMLPLIQSVRCFQQRVAA